MIGRTKVTENWLSLTLVLSAAVALEACTPSSAAEPELRTVYGAGVPLGEGSARTYVVLENGVPVEVGVALGESALQGLPEAHGHGAGHAMADLVLDLPEGNRTPYRTVVLNWNPAGHEPEPIYGLPHFDFHFYTTDEATRLSIDPADPEFAEKSAREPGPDYVPVGYVLPEPVAVPAMGVHWVDPSSPELNGETFTHTFIYGTWDGRLIFAEPMITKAFLESRPDVTLPVAAPRRWAEPGYYPAAYRIRWEDAAREYRVALTGLAPRD